MFTILKDVAGVWWHLFNNNATKVHLSDFDVIIEAVAETFVIEPRNGSNIPSRSVSISDVQVIDESISSSPISFTGADGLIALLTSLNYPPYLSNVAPQPPVKVWSKGQGSYFRRDQAWIDANFDSSGVGINEAIGWEKDTDTEGKVLIGQTTGGLFDNIGNSYGFSNTVEIAHEHDSAVLSNGKKGVNILGTGAAADGYTLVSGEANAKIVKTSKVGQDHTGAPSTVETGANKNYQPSLIVLFVKRTEDLWIMGGSAIPSLPDVIKINGREIKEINTNTIETSFGGVYNFDAEDRYKYLVFSGNGVIEAVSDDNMFDLYVGVQLLGTVATGADVTIKWNTGSQSMRIFGTTEISFVGNHIQSSLWGWTLGSDSLGGGSGTVTSVSGTTNEITVSSPTTTPVVGISSNYTSARDAYADAKVADNLTASTTVAPSKTAVNNALEFKQDVLNISTGLTNTSGTVTNNLSTGVSGGQNITLGTASGNGGIIQSTSNATKGNLFINPVVAGATVGTVTFGSDVYNPVPISGDPPHMVNLISNGTGMQLFQMYSFGSGAGVYQNNFHCSRARGTIASPTAVQLGDFGFSMGIRYYDGTNLGQSSGAFQNVATENQTTSAHGSRWQWQGTAKGSITRLGQMVLDSQGLSVGNPTSGDNTVGVTLDVWGNNLVSGADDNLHTRTNAVNKVARYLTAHFTNAEEAVATILNSNTSSANSIFIGGGSTSYNSATQINFYTGATNSTLTGTSRGNINSAGNWFIGGTTSGTAILHIKAGTATAGTAPLKLTSGTNLTTPEDGAFEFDGTNLYFTVGGVRKTVTLI